MKIFITRKELSKFSSKMTSDGSLFYFKETWPMRLRRRYVLYHSLLPLGLFMGA